MRSTAPSDSVGTPDRTRLVSPEDPFRTDHSPGRVPAACRRISQVIREWPRLPRVMLIVLGGLPGVGKTSIARAFSRSASAVHVRIDSIEQAILYLFTGLPATRGGGRARRGGLTQRRKDAEVRREMQKDHERHDGCRRSARSRADMREHARAEQGPQETVRALFAASAFPARPPSAARRQPSPSLRSPPLSGSA